MNQLHAMKHIDFDTGDAFQNLSLILLKLAQNGDTIPWKKVDRKF